MSIPTRIRLLDQLLGGGLPDRSSVLVYGPSFLGKEDLARGTFVAALQANVPAVLVLTNEAAADVREQLRLQNARFDDWERQGLAWFIDTYSRAVGAEQRAPNIEYLDGPVDLNGLTVALNRIQAQIIRAHEMHLVVLDSVSTLVIHVNAATTFRFLQVLTGRARRAGATFLFTLDQGMHTEAEVQMFRHLATGVLSVRGEPGKPQLLVEGLGVQRNPGWIDYKMTPQGIEMTGSLAGGRIR